MRHAAAFTLAELLVTIAIIGLLLAVTLPAFTGLSRGANTRGAVLQLKTALNQARQWAITHRERTGVLFPTYSNLVNNALSNYAYRTYAVWGQKSGYLSEWSFLPAGVLIATNSDVYTLAANSTIGLDGFAGGVKILYFQPDGSVYAQGGNPVKIYIYEALINPDGTFLFKMTNAPSELDVSGLFGTVKQM